LKVATVPADLKYSKTHEWIRVEGDIVTIGITDHAQAELGDVTYVDLPEPGLQLALEAQFGEVESVKAVSELFSPVSGEVVEANTEIANSTEVINEDPYGRGWLIKVRLKDAAELADLLDAVDYEKFADSEGH
jgi:glycine cleavage system H protein